MIRKDSMYRLYCISIYQLADKHAGIQNNHSTEAIYLNKYDLLNEWGAIEARKKDQTAIFLSGGTSQMITSQIEQIKELGYPLYHTFNEPDAYDSILSYSLLIPQRICDVYLPNTINSFELSNLSIEDKYKMFITDNNIDLTFDEFRLKMVTCGLNLL